MTTPRIGPATRSDLDGSDFLACVEVRIREAPSSVAIVSAGLEISYGDLGRAADAMQARLREAGVTPGALVGVEAASAPEVLVVILAALRCGAAYVPLDPAYPASRLAYMIEDSSARIVVSREASFAAPSAWMPLPTVAELLAEASTYSSAGPVTSGGEDLAYVIYTSGSTGQPKGVAMVRRALDNLIDWQCRTSAMGSADRTLQFASLSFDVSFQEIFATWASGGTLVLVDEQDRINPVALLRHLRDERIARLFVPFVALQQLAAAADVEGRVPDALREVFVAGEQLRITDPIRRLFDALPGCILENQYGPAETHVVTAHRLEGSPDSWPTLPPIGRPLPGTEVVVVDADGAPAGSDREGEMLIGGVALARGYLNRPELTAERFIHTPKGRRYRTGDLGRLGADAVLEFLGRTDQQIKIRGFRVEPGEVEAALERHPGVRAAAVVGQEDSGGSNSLVAFLRSDDEISPRELRDFLADGLPEPMVPSRFIRVDAFPLTPSGKIDRRALAALPTGRSGPVRESGGEGEGRGAVARAWARVLALDEVPPNDSFFDLGGTSVLTLRLAVELSEALGRDVPVTTVFEYPTVAKMTAHLTDLWSGPSESAPGSAAVTRTDAPIAVVGLDCRLPGAADVEEFWANLVEGVDGIRHFTRDELVAAGVPEADLDDPDFVPARGVIDEAGCFDAAFFGYTPREARLMDPQHRIFLESCWKALEAAGRAPDRMPGPTGVWGGMSTGMGYRTYLLSNVAASGAIPEQDRLQVMLGNAYDYLTTRVSYKLDLGGPSVNVQTACSTSLVAVCHAVESLRRGECDFAIAGGVSVAFPQVGGYHHQEGGIESSDGRCRPFDAGAEGTVFSDGVATVVLRRLDDALRDGDPIHAVIRGVGMNNDGSDKVSFSAPSVAGQARAIRTAQRDAGVSGSSIGYIEAHGTATQLGDPIEIAALRQAFEEEGTDSVGYCAIGSVKSNVGHTVAAAGAAGLIKTCLALSRGVIPPSLHFETPNERIDFARSPFFVVDTPTPWPEGRRRAGVSSFGLGGTNAHIVLEAPPERGPPASGRAFDIAVVSARDADALARSTAQLGRHLGVMNPADWHDGAHTTRVGRSPMEHRVAVVARSAAEASRALGCADGSARVDAGGPVRIEGTAPMSEVGVVFLFPGGGAQYPGMAADLYREEPVFREALDRCAAILGPDVDLLGLVRAVEGTDLDMERPGLALPTLFSVEYALAQLWMSWGVTPTALLGHSMGEYTAACLAGVMRLEDALSLVVTRGRLFETVADGAMTSVPLPEADVVPELGSELSLAVVNAPESCVVSGPTRAVEEFERRMDRAEVECRRVRIAVAAHSSLLEPVLDDFRRAFDGVTLSAPEIPIVSNVTGRPLTDDEATDPAYWVRHLRHTVRFADGLETLAAEGAVALVEIGPGRTLSSLARLHPSNGEGPIVASIRHADEDIDDQAFLLRSLAELWVHGVEVDWTRFVTGQGRRRVPLPTYPFSRDVFLVEPDSVVQAPTGADTGAPPATAPSLLASLNAMTQTLTTSPPPNTAAANAGPSSEPTDAQPPANPAMSQSTSRRDRILFKLKKVVQELSGIAPAELSDTASFLDMGFDSLFLTQASLGFKKEFGVRVTFRQLFEEAPNLGALAAYIDGKLDPDVQVGAPPAPAASAPAVPGAAAGQVETDQAPAGGGMPVPTGLPQGTDIHQILALQLQSTAALLAALSGGNAAVPPPSAPAETKASGDPAPPPTAPAQSAPAPQPERRAGPYREINKERVTGVTEDQLRFIAEFTERYLEKTGSSKELTQKHRDVFADPRAVAGFRKDWKEIVYPIAVERSKGARMWDIDGNEYIDAVSGFGAIFFGHAPDFVVEAVDHQLHHSLDYGPQSTIAGDVARTICDITGMDRVSFCNTGSEAVLAAMRTARTATGNDTIVTFNGDYHGIFDEVLVRRQVIGNTTRNVPMAPGIPRSASQNIVVLDYGEPESLRQIEEMGAELAGVLVEPVQSRTPELQPKEFLRCLRRICDEIEVPLIFDEIITGFRVHPRGAQGWFGVQADIAAYGKVIGGGMPIGVVAGKKLFMDALDGGTWRYGDESFPEAGVTYFAGTFIRHPLSLTAVHSVLEHLEGRGGELQDRTNRRTARLCIELNDWFDAEGLPIHLVHFGSVFLPRFGGPSEFDPIFHRLLQYHGLHIWEGRPGFLTTEHTEADIDAMIDIFRRAAREMVEGGLLKPAAKAPEAAPRRIDLTEPQTELWLAAQMGDEASRAFNEPVRFDLHGDVHLPALRRAVRQVVARHEALRTSVPQDAPGLRIHPEMDVPLREVDLSELQAEERQRELERHLLEESSGAFDLEHGPLVRFKAIRLAPDLTAFVMTAHHLACDGWSIEIAIRDIATLYNAALTGRAITLEPPMQLSEYNRHYAERQQDPEIREMEAYWLHQLEGVASPVELPTDRPRPPEKTYNGARHVVRVPADLGSRLKALSAEAGCTLFTTLLGAFNVLLHTLSGEEDVVVGVPSAGQALLGGNDLVAHCVSFLPIRSRIDAEESFTDYLGRLRSVTLDANDNQECTYGGLVEKLGLPRDPSRVPLVSTSFNLDPAIEGLEFHGVDAEYVPVPRDYSKLDLDLNVIESEGALLLEVDHNTDLIDAETALRWMEHYVTILESVAADAGRAVGSIEVMGWDEQARLIAGPGAEPGLPGADHVQEYVLQRALETPDAEAIVSGGRSVSYGELEALSSRIGDGLRERLRPGGEAAPCVGVLLDRTPEMVAALLGIWRAGATWVPLDPDFPEARLRQVIEDAGLDAVVTTPELEHLAPGTSCVRLGDLLDHEGRLASEFATDLAYVIYTSGSTGRPKGVEIGHRSVVNFLRSMAKRPGLSASDRLVAVTTIAFDISVLELFLPLSVGACVVLASRETARDGVALAGLLASSGATVMQATPTHWALLLEAGWEGDPALRMLAGGEALPRVLADRLVDVGGELWNMYGPTETTIWSACHPVRRSSDASEGVGIGRPILGTRVWVLNAALRPVPPGVPGELFIGGEGLARGYRGRPDLTEERFPVTASGERLYRTGDRVRFDATGKLEFLRRSDRQVKIRGFRVELGDVESALDGVAGVRRSYAAVRSFGPGDTRLTAWAEVSGAVDVGDLRQSLRATLPDYMVPQSIVPLERFPLTPNGKIDANALPDPLAQTGAEDAAEGWVTPLEARVAAAWESALGVSGFGRHDDFFDLGGHSVLATRVIGILRAEVTPELGLRDLFTNPTVATLASRLDGLAATSDAVSAKVEEMEEFVF